MLGANEHLCHSGGLCLTKRKRRKVTLKADSLLGAKLEDFSQPRSIMSERFPKVFALWPKSIANTLHRRKMEIYGIVSWESKRHLGDRNLGGLYGESNSRRGLVLNGKI
jgi:hypothetical protein